MITLAHITLAEVGGSAALFLAGIFVGTLLGALLSGRIRQLLRQRS